MATARSTGRPGPRGQVPLDGSTRDSTAGSTGASRYAGTYFVLGFLFFANANTVLSGRLLQTLNPFVFLFWSFVATALFYALRLLITRGPRGLVPRPGSTLPLVMLNGTTALTWVGYYYALRFIEPAIVSALMGGLGPLCTIALDRLVRHRRLPLLSYAAAAGILCGTALLAWSSLAGVSAVRELDVADTLIGLGAGIVGGVFQALNTVATKQLGDRGWQAGEIMVHRFYLLVVAAGVSCVTGPGFAVTSPTEVALLSVATVFGGIVPLWLLQRGILASEPFLVASLLALAPIVAYVLQIFDSRLSLSPVSALGCLVVVTFTLLSVRANALRSAR